MACVRKLIIPSFEDGIFGSFWILDLSRIFQKKGHKTNEGNGAKKPTVGKHSKIRCIDLLCVACRWVSH